MARARVFRLEVVMENAAFAAMGEMNELSRLLVEAGTELRRKGPGWEGEKRMVDVNGNTVGRFEIEEEEQDVAL